MTLLAVPMGAALVLAFRDGGYFLSSWGVAAIMLWGVLACGTIVLGPRFGGWPGLAALVGLVGLAVWQGLSVARAAEPAAAVNAMNMTALYAAVLGLGLLGVRGRLTLHLLTWLALAAVSIVALDGVGARLLPGVIGGDVLARLNTPISYWNAEGALFAFGIVIAVGLAGTATLRPSRRALGMAPMPLLGFGLFLTLSRGAILLLGVCLVLLVAFAPGRIETVVALVVGAAATVPLVVVANDRGDLSALDGVLPAHAHSGRVLALMLLSATAGAVVATWVLGLITARLGSRTRRATGITLAALVLVVALVGYAARPPAGGPFHWADRQIESFKSYGSNDRSDASLESQLGTAAGTGRWQNWGVAVDEFHSAPLTGTGAGDYRFWWSEHRPIGQYVVNAHSAYLEVLGESGLIGLALLATPLIAGLVVLVVVLVRSRAAALRRDVVVASVAALLIALHVAGDWDWQLPAVMFPALLLGAGALKAGTIELRLDRTFGWWAEAVTAAFAVMAVVVVMGPIASGSFVDRAKAQARSGDLTGALATAERAVEADDGSPTGHLVQAYVLTDLGRAAQADRAFADALARSPRDWSIMADWAGSLIARGQFAAARPLVRRARALNPRETRVAALEELLSAPKA